LNVNDSAAGSPQSVSLTGGICSIEGTGCTPYLPPCCPGLKCVIMSTRAHCEPATSQIGDRTPILRDRLPDK
jgi:hypothetical protein